MKVLVTGGAGFIGSHITRGLLDRGHDVIVADNLATGRLSNLEGVENQLDFRKLDLTNLNAAHKAVEGAEAVFHEAAIPSVPRSVADPVGSNNANINATLNVLVAARDAGIRRFVYAASSSAYGEDPTLPKVETHTPRPMSPYAIGKLTGEYYCSAFHKLYGMETIALRYFNVFGPRQDPKSEYAAVIPKFITLMLAGTRPTIYGDGEQSRDFTYIQNVVDANLLALEARSGFGETMNAACGDRFSLNQLYNRLKEILTFSEPPIYEEARAGDVKHSQADIRKIRDTLGFEPRVSFEDGLRRTVEWYRLQGGTASA